VVADLPNPGREVGVMLDASAQHAGRTGPEILTVARQTMGLPAGRVAKMVDRVGLSAAEAERRVGSYSWGMRQRLGVAVAVIGAPLVLILDEPANGLDPAGIRWMRDLLRDFPGQAGLALTRVVGVELRKMFDTRAGIWLMASILIAALVSTVATIAFAPQSDLTYDTFAKAIGFPMTVILPIIAVLAITGEWTQRHRPDHLHPGAEPGPGHPGQGHSLRLGRRGRDADRPHLRRLPATWPARRSPEPTGCGTSRSSAAPTSSSAASSRC
jgi:ABC transporter